MTSANELKKECFLHFAFESMLNRLNLSLSPNSILISINPFVAFHLIVNRFKSHCLHLRTYLKSWVFWDYSQANVKKVLFDFITNTPHQMKWDWISMISHYFCQLLAWRLLTGTLELASPERKNPHGSKN